MILYEVFCWDKTGEKTGRLCFYVPILANKEKQAIERAMAMHPSLQKRQSDGEQFYFLVRAVDSVLEEKKLEPEPTVKYEEPPEEPVKRPRGRPRKY